MNEMTLSSRHTWQLIIACLKSPDFSSDMVSFVALGFFHSDIIKWRQNSLGCSSDAGLMLGHRLRRWPNI